MRVDFYIFSANSGKTKNMFFRTRNWPVAVPEQGWEITFVVRGKDENQEVRLQRGVVKDVSQTEEQGNDVWKVWVDMEELSEIQIGSYCVEGWAKAQPPSKTQ